MSSLSLDEVKIFLQTGNFDLKPTQKKLCLPILQRIYHKMKIGVPFNSIHVTGNLLIEGHHRYICSLLTQQAIGINTWEKPSYATVLDWWAVEVEEQDWETREIIERHNAKDAARSGIDIKTLEL